MMLSLTLAMAFQGALVPGDTFAIGRSFVLRSDRLGESRRIVVSAPPGYAATSRRYPVLVVLDGELPFLEAVMASRLLVDAADMPPVIVVGVWNGDRTRDFTPALPPGTTPPPGFASCCGLDAFHGFLADELMPALADRYRIAQLKILLGYSLGGLVAIDAVVRPRAVFAFGIALDPSLWWESRSWARRVPARLAAVTAPRRLVTVETAEGWREVWEPLVAAARDPVRVVRFELRDESHGTMHYKGTFDALRALFTDYPPAIRRGDSATLAALTGQYAALRTAYGYDVPIPRPALVVVANQELGRRNLAAAREAIERFETLHGPDWQTRQLRARADSLAAVRP